jgi:hypothetical protein
MAEIKTQLQKEAVKVRVLDAALQEAKDKIHDLQKGSLFSLDLSAEAGASQPSPSARAGVVPTSVENEVSEALTQALVQTRSENYNIRRTLKALQEHLELLQEDVNQKKEMIRNFVAPIALSFVTAEDSKQAQARLEHFMRQPKNAQEQLFTKLELILQETTITNIRLKEELKKVGTQSYDLYLFANLVTVYNYLFRF